MGEQIFKPVDAEDIRNRLSDPALDQVVVDDLFQFGSLVLAEVRQRISWVESKLTIILGWSMAGLAFLLVGPSGVQFPIRKWIAGALLASTIVAIFGLKSKLLAAISEGDWFKYSRGGPQIE